MTAEEQRIVETALRNSKAFIEGMLEVGGIPPSLCAMSADIHTQIQKAEKIIESLVLASDQREREAFEAGREDAEYSIYKEMIYFKYDTFKDYEKEKQSIKT